MKLLKSFDIIVIMFNLYFFVILCYVQVLKDFWLSGLIYLSNNQSTHLQSPSKYLLTLWLCFPCIGTVSHGGVFHEEGLWTAYF